ncbi:dehydrogenase/reductase SDR family member 11-like [Triplophysa dalaica]|uniref:dehydrogenase/reductase SDR family member 11-like n=1 Tax=Triplophysa dalaica TaxID=1582913 RepID=UPI0024DF5F63|nr:dehydrogenase/reductase SDR family member 11-like [Triplophysa dalaica]
MDRWRGRVALVTGASVGIGAAIAKSLTQHGMKVIGCARNVEQIESLASECVHNGFSGTLVPYKCDLSIEEEILSMFAWIKDQHHGIEVCINNAGLAFPEPLLCGKTSYWRTMMDVNVIGLSVCTREAYQSMKERNVNDGHIININSMCGHRVMNHADAHFYTATKYAVTALTEGLRQELRENKSHIRATSISPGLVETKFTTRFYSDKPEIAAAAYRRIKCLQAEDIANALVYVLSCPSHVQIGDLQVMPLEQMYL